MGFKRISYFLAVSAFLLSVTNIKRTRLSIHHYSENTFFEDDKPLPQYPAKAPPQKLPEKETQTVANFTDIEIGQDGFKIPRRLIFSHKDNRFPTHIYNNLHNTIKMYAQAWNQSPEETKVLFFDDSACKQVIQEVEPSLLRVYGSEVYGPYKSDICRTCALYLHGGYYFDCDIEVLRALEPDSDVDLVTGDSLWNGQFYNAFILSPPKSPILRSTLDSMINDWYFNKPVMKEYMKTFNPKIFQSKKYQDALKTHIKADYGLGKYINDPNDIIMGPMTLRVGYDKHKDSTNAWILHEIENKQSILFNTPYPDLVRNSKDWGERERRLGPLVVFELIDDDLGTHTSIHLNL
jgi:mannosyltransferase OCH1-like enzyme